MKKIILASQSPRRKQLLEWAEIEFDIIASGADEVWPPSMPLEDVPVHIALNKAKEVQQTEAYQKYVSHLPILAADTVVLINNQILGKPVDREEAIEMLLTLSGQQHRVITGVVLLENSRVHTFSETTEVTFHQLSRQEIENYVEHYQPYDKAGAYAIQEWIGVVGIQGIKGDFYNVMGLPVSRVVRLLREIS